MDVLLFVVNYFSIQHFTFWKTKVPEDNTELNALRSKLMKFDVSLRLYRESLEKDDITG